MKIDCATCPGRNRACDGCLMQVLFAPVNRDFGPGDGLDPKDRELLDAVDVLAATQLISPTVARAARVDIGTGQGVDREDGSQRLRAV